MNILYPQQFIQRAKYLGEGRVFGCERPILPTAKCGNCGDLTIIMAFEVAAGPFQFYPQPKKDQVSTYNDDTKSWYVGQWLTAPCPVCSGDSSKMQYWITSNCGLSETDLDIRLDDFTMMKGKEEARITAGKLLSMTPSPSGFVTYWGGYGVGKTTLLKALVNGFRLAGVMAVYVRMSEVLNDFREGYDTKTAVETIINRYAAYRVLAIDEIDRVNITNWGAEVMPAFLDVRYNQAKTVLTIMATNTNPETFPDNLKYLGSRMSSGTMVEVGGADVRRSQGVEAKRELLDWTV